MKRVIVRGAHNMQITLHCAGGNRSAASAHHRFLYFHAHYDSQFADASLNEVEVQLYKSGGKEMISAIQEVWGIIERLEDAAECHLFRVNKIGNRKNSHLYDDLSGQPMNNESIGQLFCDEMGARWKGPYDLRCNNCIDYAIGCWNLLRPQCAKPTVGWYDVYQVSTQNSPYNMFLISYITYRIA